MDEDGDDEVQITGRKGELALIDFPHSRENCSVKKFVPGNEHHTCPNCYCYVCDIPASKCTEWQSHCKATHTSPHWQGLRAAKKAGSAQPAAAAAAGSSSAPAPRDYVQRWSCDKLLEEIQQVYPVETEPEGLLEGTTLRPYQRQDVAFMVNVEKNGHTSAASADAKPGSAAAPVRAGWLCDEMGMGKTMVCTALVLANPCTDPPVSNERFNKLLTGYDASIHPIPLKLTLIIVNNTLVQQWYDEITQHAPNLNVHMFYNDAKKKAAALKGLREADILITTPHMILPNDLAHKMSIHRMIIDESHLLAHGSTTHSKLGALQAYKAGRKWCVTGTPFSSTFKQLECQAMFLGHWDRGIKVEEFLEAGRVPDGCSRRCRQAAMAMAGTAAGILAGRRKTMSRTRRS